MGKKKRSLQRSERLDPFASKVTEAVVEHIKVFGKCAEFSFAVACVNLQKAKDRQLPADLEQPMMMIAVCPVEPRPLRVDVVAISNLFQRLDTLSAFTRLKGGRASCLRFNGFWEEDYYVALDVFLAPDTETMQGEAV